MEITKMFSSCNGEKLFTVCFSELELRLYSEYLEQKEYVSKREAKKLAKKALNAEQEFQDAVKSGVDTTAANAKYNKKMGKIMGSKNAQKILEHDTKSASTTVKAIKNDRAAEQTAGAIGNGNQDVKAKVSENLKKSKGGKGVNVQQHVSVESYKQDRIKQANSDLKNSWDKVKHRLREQVIEDVDGLNKQYEGQSIPKHLVTKPTKKISKSKVALGVAGVTGAATIGKKLYDKKKKKNKK